MQRSIAAIFRGPEFDDLMMSTELSDREFVSDFTHKATQKVGHLESETLGLSRTLKHSEVKARSFEEQMLSAELQEVKKKNEEYRRMLNSIGYV